MGGKTIEKTCRCGKKFTARVADVNRGWAKSCSKSCAAIKREKKTGTYKRFLYEREYGGIANFNSNGEYIGFQCDGFSNED